MSRFTYRDAVESDAAALARLSRDTWVATFGDLYPPEDLNAYLTAKYGEAIQCAEIADPSGCYRLAFDGDAMVGYCKVNRITHLPVQERDAAELDRLYVADSAKGAGVAQALMRYAVAWARERGATAMYLSVWENNHRAQRFYRWFGFAGHGEWEFMVGSVADRDLIWRLAL